MSADPNTHEGAIAEYARYAAEQRAKAGEPGTDKQSIEPGPLSPKEAGDEAIRLLVPRHREQRIREAAERADAERAAMPPPRELLRAAHATRDAARSEAARLKEAHGRALEYLAVAETARNEARSAVDAEEIAAGEHLVEELTLGSPGRIEIAASGELRMRLAAAERDAAVAKRAADGLGTALAGAEAKLADAVAQVQAAIVAVLTEDARTQARSILAAADTIDADRVRLDALTMQISDLRRRLPPGPQFWPHEVPEALTPELRAAPNLPSKFVTPEGDVQVRRWADLARRLAEDASAE